MTKATVVFSTNKVVVEGGKPWLDSDGNKAYPEVYFGSDVSKRLDKAEKERDELKAQLERAYKFIFENYPDHFKAWSM